MSTDSDGTSMASSGQTERDRHMLCMDHYWESQYCESKSDVTYDDLEVDLGGHRNFKRVELRNGSTDLDELFFVLLDLIRTTCGPNGVWIFRDLQGQIQGKRILTKFQCH